MCNEEGSFVCAKSIVCYEENKVGDDFSRKRREINSAGINNNNDYTTTINKMRNESTTDGKNILVYTAEKCTPLETKTKVRVIIYSSFRCGLLSLYRLF
jgi:hypothetical protein